MRHEYKKLLRGVISLCAVAAGMLFGFGSSCFAAMLELTSSATWTDLSALNGYEGVTIPDGCTLTLALSADAALDGRWIVAGTVRKTGACALTIPAENIWFAEGRLDVMEGTVDLTKSTGVMSSFDASPVKNKSVFWVKADQNLEKDGDSVVRWRDARDASGGAYPFARAVTDFSGGGYPTHGVTAEGLPYIDFGGYGSGQMMEWRTKDGSGAARYQTIHAFAVYNPMDVHGHFLGTVQNNEQQQHFAVNNGPAGDTLFANTFRSAPNYFDLIRSGRVFVDGVRTIPNAKIRKNQIQLIETEAGRHMPVADAFFTFCNGKKTATAELTTDWIGGGRLHEVLIYTNKLTECERLLVETELTRAWVHPGLKGPSVVYVASEAVLSTPAGYLAGAKVRSDGTIAASSFGGTVMPDKGVYGCSIAELTGDAAFRNPALVPVANIVGKNVTVDREQTTAIAEGTEGVMVKDGVGALPLAPVGQAKLRLNAGRASFASVGTSLPKVTAGNLLKNGDFEGIGSELVTYTKDGQQFGAWESIASVSMRFHKNDQWGDRFPANPGWYAHIKDKSGFRQTFAVANEGRYRLAFKMTTRRDDDSYAGGVVSVYIDDALLVRVPSSNKNAWVPYRYLTPTLTEGNHTITFKHEHTGDVSSALDDISLVFEDSVCAANVPNGNFDCLQFGEVDSRTPSFATGGSAKFESGDYVQGWTSPDASRIWLVRTADEMTTFGGDNSALAPLSGGLYDVVLRYGAQLETTFTVDKAGVYHVEGDFGKAGIWTSDGDEMLANQADIPFTVAVNGDTENRVTSAFSFEHQICDRRYRLAKGDRVTLKLAVANTVGHRIVADNISFVADPDDSANLLDNPSFAKYEEGGDWTAPGWEFEKKAGRILIRHLDDPNFGTARIDGEMHVRIRGEGDAIYQTVTFPEAGAYRFTFWARSRTDLDNTTFSYGPSGLDANLIVEGKTRVLGSIKDSDISIGYRKYSYTFNVPTANMSAKIGVAGTTAGDKTAMVDAFSLTKVREEKGYAPVTRDTSIVVAPGATLALDYVGTLNMGSLKLGGHGVDGRADSSAKGIEGSGALNAHLRGMVLSVR